MQIGIESGIRDIHPSIKLRSKQFMMNGWKNPDALTRERGLIIVLCRLRGGLVNVP